MSEIDAVIDVFEKQIQALYTNDFEKFLSFMTPQIRKELTIDVFQKAIDLYKRKPIGINAIDREKSKMYNEGESEELPDKHVKLSLVWSGRTLCHVVNINGAWLIDDIYWRITDSNEEDGIEVSETEELEPQEIESETDNKSEINEPIPTPINENEEPANEIESIEEEKADEDRQEEEESTDEEHT